MGKDWDHGIPGVAFWKEALRVAKPGAILMAFGGTRTVHRLACAIEDAGWEIRDRMQWIYAQGFPKSLNIGKQLDKKAGANREVIGQYKPPEMDKPWNLKNAKDERTIPLSASSRNNLDITAPSTKEAKLWDGWGTALKPAHEPIIVAMKPIEGTYVENALKWGVAGLWIDGSRIDTITDKDKNNFHQNRKEVKEYKADETLYELGMKTVSTSEHPEGRWPANILHDGSDEVLAEFPQSKGAQAPVKGTEPSRTGDRGIYSKYGRVPNVIRGDTGSAARFFYCAKASKSERNAGLEGMPDVQKYAKNGRGGSHEIFTSESANDTDWAKKNPNLPTKNYHPTVKPLKLMQYLCRLTKTPTGGIVLDPFMGSGTTGVACANTGREFVGIELDKDYFAIAEKRIKQAEQQMRLI